MNVPTLSLKITSGDSRNNVKKTFPLARYAIVPRPEVFRENAQGLFSALDPSGGAYDAPQTPGQLGGDISPHSPLQYYTDWEKKTHSSQPVGDSVFAITAYMRVDDDDS